MGEKRMWEALWRLKNTSITTEAVATRFFASIGSITPIDPHRYDLNQRSQWRPFEQSRFIVDALTQRTQVITLAEKADLDEGGSVVMIATGKRDDPPQAVARWWESWPPSADRIEEFTLATDQAFQTLSMDRFILSLTDEDSPRVVATTSLEQIASIEKAIGPSHQTLAKGAKIWLFLSQDGDSSPPVAWNEFWTNHG